MRRPNRHHPLSNLQPLTRTGGAIECGECRRPILVDHCYWLAPEDIDANHPFCWTCGASVKIHLGELSADDLFRLRQFGPLRSRRPRRAGPHGDKSSP